ncbi:MAG: phosphatidylserine decarboxylase family protein [Candidatus Binatia bacterium]|nr:phosphatidylserine decarboxylase family protein [Candidatus Binatia bacterium]
MAGDDGFPLAPDGYRPISTSFLLAGAAWACVALTTGALAIVLGVVASVCTFFGLFFTNFFRDPRRTPPGDATQLVSPADGKVLIAEPSVEEKRFLRQDAAKISIFMSPLDVHVNRAPVDGEVVAVHYNPGKFFAAFSEKASLDNEQNAIVMRAADGRELVFIQIAGFLARRIVCRVKAGETCERGGRVGMIKLGSRVDIFVPGGFKLNVKPGDRVTAGETVLGQLG